MASGTRKSRKARMAAARASAFGCTAPSISGFGNDSYLSYLGDLGATHLNKPIVGMAATPDGGLAVIAYAPTVVNAIAGGTQVLDVNQIGTAGPLQERTVARERGARQPGVGQDRGLAGSCLAAGTEGLASEDGAGVDRLAVVEALLLPHEIAGHEEPPERPFGHDIAREHPTEQAVV